jgi:DNA-binding NarL/FixJ family response regulator
MTRNAQQTKAARNAAMIEDIQAGMSVGEVAKKYRVCHQRVSQIVKRDTAATIEEYRGYKASPLYRRDVRQVDVLRLYAAGMTGLQVAEALNIGSTAVYRRLHLAGVKKGSHDGTSR